MPTVLPNVDFKLHREFEREAGAQDFKISPRHEYVQSTGWIQIRSVDLAPLLSYLYLVGSHGR